LAFLKSTCRCNNREPLFNASSHVLQLQVGGRSVTVPVPQSIEAFEPTAEQPPPDCPAPRIEWAYGYRGKDVRNNVHYLPTGELVYFSGSVVVMHNIKEHYQRHYTGHTSDVKCICIHPSRVLVASGQTTCHRRDRRPEFDRRDTVVTPLDIENELDHNHTEAHIRIWDSITLATLHVIGGSKAMFEKAIAALAFSSTDGN
ncbi:HELP domain protein, partial [Cooperia oncophora]